MSAKVGTMTPEHPDWQTFRDRLEGEEGCNFHEGPTGIQWSCGGGYDQSHAARILKAMGFTKRSIDASLLYFREHGGHCDCEILFNVGQS